MTSIDKELEGVELPDDVLLRDGLFALDKALESIMEMKCDLGKALANIVHGALVFGEGLQDAMNNNDSELGEL